MRYWFDTEFIEDGKTIDLISIGIVSEDGREFYAQNSECDHSRASDWVKENVIAKLAPRKHDLLSLAAIRSGVLDFVGATKPEFWAYFADYDWVVLCQLFGTMMDLPKGWPMYCRDVKQLCDDLGNPDLPAQMEGEHHALADARWTREAWNYLQDFRKAA
jgi:hypothetical protein